MKLFSSATLSALLTTGTVGLVMSISATASIRIFETYGYSLFLGVPFVGGAVATWLYGRRRTLQLSEMFKVTSLTALFCGLHLLLMGTEGLICLLMSAPIALPMAWAGGCLALIVKKSLAPFDRGGKASVGAFLPLVIALMVEPSLDLPVELREVSTSVEIQADAMAVWDVVIAFPPIEEEPGFPFTFGIAYPSTAIIEGQGVGAIRECQFNTGAFVEPITVWEPGRRLEFDVLSSPAPMIETSIYSSLDLPHLSGTFESKRGRFLLEQTDHGTVILTGTTWYSQKLWPQFYWNRLADPIVHSIHRRVLRHIKNVVEQGGTQ